MGDPRKKGNSMGLFSICARLLAICSHIVLGLSGAVPNPLKPLATYAFVDFARFDLLVARWRRDNDQNPNACSC